MLISLPETPNKTVPQINLGDAFKHSKTTAEKTYVDYSTRSSVSTEELRMLPY